MSDMVRDPKAIELALGIVDHLPALRGVIADDVGEKTASAVVDTLIHGTPREHDECGAFLAGLPLADPHAVIAPASRYDSATKAGMLKKGQFRQVPPAILDGKANITPGDRHYAPGDGYARIRAMLAEVRANAQMRGQIARTERSAKPTERAMADAKQGAYVGATYCAGYRAKRK